MNAALKVLLVAVAMMLSLYGAVMADAKANADTSLAELEVTVCMVLNADPTFHGLDSVATGLLYVEGLTPQVAAQVLSYAVTDVCPQHIPLVQAAVASLTPVAKY